MLASRRTLASTTPSGAPARCRPKHGRQAAAGGSTHTQPKAQPESTNKASNRTCSSAWLSWPCTAARSRCSRTRSSCTSCHAAWNSCTAATARDVQSVHVSARWGRLDGRPARPALWLAAGASARCSGAACAAGGSRPSGGGAARALPSSEACAAVNTHKTAGSPRPAPTCVFFRICNCNSVSSCKAKGQQRAQPGEGRARQRLGRLHTCASACHASRTEAAAHLLLQLLQL